MVQGVRVQPVHDKHCSVWTMSTVHARSRGDMGALTNGSRPRQGVLLVSKHSGAGTAVLQVHDSPASVSTHTPSAASAAACVQRASTPKQRRHAAGSQRPAMRTDTPGVWSPRPKCGGGDAHLSDIAAGLGTAAPVLSDLTAVYQPAVQRRASTAAPSSREASEPAAMSPTGWSAGQESTEVTPQRPSQSGVASLDFSPLAIGLSSRFEAVSLNTADTKQRLSGRLSKAAHRAAACLGISEPSTSPGRFAVRRSTSTSPLDQPTVLPATAAPGVPELPIACCQPAICYSPLGAAASSASWAAPLLPRAVDVPEAVPKNPAAAVRAVAQPGEARPASVQPSGTPVTATAADKPRQRPATARPCHRTSQPQPAGSSAGKRLSGMHHAILSNSFARP
jgi:hypothetical protein